MKKPKDILNTSPHIFIIRLNRHKNTLSKCYEFSECLLLVSGPFSSGLVANAHRLALVYEPHFKEDCVNIFL